MNEKEFINIIKVIERKYSDYIMINSKNFWPLLRMLLYQHMTGAKNKKKNSQIKLGATEKIKNLFKNINNLNKLNSKIKKKKNIFFSRLQYLQKIKKNNLFYDRIFDGLLHNKKIFKDSEKIYISNIDIKKNIAYKSLRTYPFLNILNKNEIKIKKELKKIIYKIISENKLNHSILEEFINSVKVFYIWFEHGIKIFKNNPSIKKVFFAPWYNPDSMGLIAAAKKFNILSHDMQHGVQGEYRGMYTDWNKIGSNGYELLPNFFLCWNHRTKKNILLSSKYRKNNIPIVVGNSWVQFYEKNLKLKLKKKINKKKTILFTMQPPTKKNNILIPQFIKSFLNSSYFKDDVFIFRFHPNDFSRDKEIKNFIKNHKKKSQLIIDYSEYYILDALEKCTHHITGFSSVALEASYLGIKSAVFGEDSKLIYNYYIKKRFLTHLDGSNKNFLNWINSIDKYLQKSITKKELYLNKLNNEFF